MVDSPAAMDSANDDFERPTLSRSNTAKKAAGLFGGLFNMTGRSEPRTRSTPVTDNEDNATPTRSRGTSRRRSRVMSPAEGFTTDALGETDADVARKRRRAAEKAEETERLAREQRRRERREREKADLEARERADLEARQQRAREQARKEREAEQQRKEERRARRREREEKERLAQEAAEAEAAAAAERRREERRLLREKLQAEANIKPLTRDDRRRTYADGEAQRKSRTRPTSARQSTALMAEYHESRSGSGRGIKPPANKTSSWLDQQKDEPPDILPIEPTVLDESGQIPRPVDENSRRKHREKYEGMTEAEIAAARAKRRERRIVEKSTSGGSDEKARKEEADGVAETKRRKRRSRAVEDDYYGAEPVKASWDSRPQQSKRSSFLGKFF